MQTVRNISIIANSHVELSRTWNVITIATITTTITG